MAEVAVNFEVYNANHLHTSMRLLTLRLGIACASIVDDVLARYTVAGGATLPGCYMIHAS